MTDSSRYPGGKGGDGTYQQIINHIPPHKVFVSGFAGKCAIFRYIQPCSITVLNDADPSIITWWRTWLKNNRDCIINDNFIQMQLFSPLTKPSVILRNNDAIKIIDRFKNNPDTFIFLDPPYPMVVRKSKRQLYAFEFAEPEMHSDLLFQCSICKCDVMICTYENEMYNTQLLSIPPINPRTNEPQRTWYKHTFKAQTRGGTATECIYFNYPPPAILHDFRYLGKNFRERERIKKKVSRFIAKMNSIPEFERCAILSAVVQQHSQTINSIIEL